MIFPARLVFHDDGNAAHYDLFIKTGQKSPLVTYKIYDLPEKLSFFPADWEEKPQNSENSENSELTDPPLIRSICRPNIGSVSAERIRDHRLKYWEYEGPVSGKGFIQEILRGKAEFHGFPELTYFTFKSQEVAKLIELMCRKVMSRKWTS